MKYIDAEKLIAEIDNKLLHEQGFEDGDSEYGYKCALKDIKRVITYLQQEQPTLSSELDEAANNYGVDIRLGYPRVMDETDKYIYNAFKSGAEWMAGQFQKIEGELVDWYSTSDGRDYCCGFKSQDAFEVPEGFYIKKK